mgnify:CR=1 FL=1
MRNCQLCTHDIDNHGKDGCYTPGCNCQRTHLHTDHPDYAELARENADLRAKLANAEQVIADYTATIREYMAAEKAAKATRGEPMAWMVFLPKGEEYDYAVFPHVEDAKQHAELLDADEEEGAEPRGVIPLYAGCDKA